jgi:hypothetical protein
MELTQIIESKSLKIELPHLTKKLQLTYFRQKSLSKRIEKLTKYLTEFVQRSYSSLCEIRETKEKVDAFFKMEDPPCMSEIEGFMISGGDAKKAKIPLLSFKESFPYNSVVDIDDIIEQHVKLSEPNKISFDEFTKILSHSRYVASLLIRNERSLHASITTRRSIIDNQKKVIPMVRRRVIMKNSAEGSQIMDPFEKEFDLPLDQLIAKHNDKTGEISRLEIYLDGLRKEVVFLDSKIQKEKKRFMDDNAKKALSYYIICLNAACMDPLFTDENTRLHDLLNQPDNSSNITFDEKQIKTASKFKLFQKLTSPLEYDGEYTLMFLFTYRSFCTSEEFLDILIYRYNTPPPKKEMTDEEFDDFKTKILVPIRLRVTQILSTWITYHNYIFKDQALKDRVLQFVNEMTMTHMEKPAQKIINAFEKMDEQDKQMRHSRAFSTIVAKKVNPWSFSEDKIAEQLTLITFKIFKKLQPKEFLNKNWTEESRAENAPNLQLLIKRSNDVGNWVAAECIKKDIRERSTNIAKFIKIAQKAAYELHNYNLLMEICSGLNSSGVYRMKKTWSMVSEDLLKIFKDLNELLSPKGSFKKLRQEIKKTKPPRIPYIGMYLYDTIILIS